MIKIYSFLEIKIIKLFINYVFKMNIFIKNVSEKIIILGQSKQYVIGILVVESNHFTSAL